MGTGGKSCYPKVTTGSVLLFAVVLSARIGAQELPSDSGGDEPAVSETNQNESDQLSWEFGLLQTESTLTSVITKSKSLSQQEAPGVLTILTREEIERSGARDLIDLLNLVPGFAFGADVYSSVFTGFRGLWAADGKVLILWNGHEMHELLYTEAFLANRFPMDQIERVEIIRGPGSLAYGGAAELAVVNIVTHAPKDLNGMRFAAAYGQMLDGIANHNQSLENTFGRRTISLEYGQVLQQLDDLSLHLGLFAGQGFLSDRQYTNLYGGSYSMAGNSRTNPFLLDFTAEYRGLKLRYLFEDYFVTQRDGYGESYPSAVSVSFRTSSLIASYDWKILKELKLIPVVRYVWQKPWQSTGDNAQQEEIDAFWEPRVQRVQAGVSAVWDPFEFLNILVGFDYTYDWAEDYVDGFYDKNNPTQNKYIVNYQTIATYIQGLLNTKYVNVLVGARFEHHSVAGSNIVPQVVLTKSFGRFYLKALFAEAFRAPSIMNFAYEIQPNVERTLDFEVEAGWQICDYLWVAANAFDLTINKPIVYHVDADTAQESYQNIGRTGSRGVELQVRFRYKRFYSWLSYSFYDAAGMNTIETYKVPGYRHVLLGFAPHKLAFNGGVEIIQNLTVNLSGTLLSNRRFGYASADVDGNPILKEFSPELLINVYLLYKNVGVRGLSVALGVYNILNSETFFIQPYNNGHAPLPGPSTEVLLKIGYEVPFGSPD